MDQKVLQFSKYNTRRKHGAIDNLIILELVDDVAHIQWGSRWRMPTCVEFEELKSECMWKWTSLDGVNGYLIKSSKNENSIFLPAGGMIGDRKIEEQKRGYYWLSTLVKKKPDQADAMAFDYFATNIDQYYTDDRFPNMFRCCGCLVRPVIE